MFSSFIHISLMNIFVFWKISSPIGNYWCTNFQSTIKVLRSQSIPAFLLITNPKPRNTKSPLFEYLGLGGDWWTSPIILLRVQYPKFTISVGRVFHYRDSTFVFLLWHYELDITCYVHILELTELYFW